MPASYTRDGCRRWIKQQLPISAVVGTSPNAVRTRIGIAITVYVLVAIVKRRLGTGPELYTSLTGPLCPCL